MRILITGAEGFLGKNLQLRLSERKEIEVFVFTRANTLEELENVLGKVDFIFHLAGVNRAYDPKSFFNDNLAFSRTLANSVAKVFDGSNRKIPIVFASSTQAESNNFYGRSKLDAEEVFIALGRNYGVPIHIFRLANIFGKWCKPNYNSVVATFCYNIARELPISIHDPNALLHLIYIDDVVENFIALIDSEPLSNNGVYYRSIKPEYSCTVLELAEFIREFHTGRLGLKINRVGSGLIRALYATYISYLPPENFVYPVPQYVDVRGIFVEMLKTEDSGQFSFFTAHPGVTRGGHYHHSKTEKFLVLHGEACFKFRHLYTGEACELKTIGSNPMVVDSIPGWAHDITNIGATELIVMVWVNEVFDPNRPDTYRAVCS